MSEPIYIGSPRSYAHLSTQVLWKSLVNTTLPLALSLIVAPGEVVMGSAAIPGTDYFLSWGVTWDAKSVRTKRVTIEISDEVRLIHSTSELKVIVAQDTSGAEPVDDYTQPTTYDPIISPYINSQRFGDMAESIKLATIQAEAIDSATTNAATLLVVGNSRTIAIA